MNETNQRKLMLDSGAYSVWNKGSSVDLEKYIKYCVEHPDITYYFNLDVLSKNLHDTEKNAKAGFDNYTEMVKYLPKEKVIPTFHSGEDFSWLQKYIDMGVDYIALGAVAKRTKQQRILWLNKCKKYLYEQNTAKIKVHGLGVTDFDIMKYFDWHSVDSTTWILAAAFGSIIIPKKTNNDFDYSKKYYKLPVSVESPKFKLKNQHFLNLPKKAQEIVFYFLDKYNVPLGKYEIKKVEKGYILQNDEKWFNKQKTEVLIILEKGIITHLYYRQLFNIYYFLELQKTGIVPNIYLAGSSYFELEKIQRIKLISFAEVNASEKHKIIDYHIRKIKHQTRLERQLNG